MRSRKQVTDIVESTALTASFLCLIHCLALPLLLLILPGILGVFAASEGFHLAAFLLVAPAAFIAFWLGYRRHGAIVPALTGLAGVICLAAALLPRLHDWETLITVAGSLLLVTGHIWNWRKRRETHCQSGNQHSIARRH
ncbi:MerC domain-containing protein [Altericroceibacterium spongiae]|uniref:MerC domain-containing protein n=1 Tax=Altericroceibacterium spongiae TaxID=2320269 RepID=UPI0015FFB234|nr:MerC domain-containing protein [Altericroceibacterium spongiae]